MFNVDERARITIQRTEEDKSRFLWHVIEGAGRQENEAIAIDEKHKDEVVVGSTKSVIYKAIDRRRKLALGQWIRDMLFDLTPSLEGRPDGN